MRSELSQAEFCRRRGVPLATFHYHRAHATARIDGTLAAQQGVDELFVEQAGPMTGADGETSLRLQLDLSVGPVTVHGGPAAFAELLSLLTSSLAPTRP